MDAGLKQNKTEACNAELGSFKIITESLLEQKHEDNSHKLNKNIMILHKSRMQSNITGTLKKK